LVSDRPIPAAILSCPAAILTLTESLVREEQVWVTTVHI